jgi:hypothetical protein
LLALALLVSIVAVRPARQRAEASALVEAA